MITTEFKVSLQKYQGRRTRHTCPQCRKPHQFTLYIDNETGQPFPPHVGKCNRLDNCGYHYPPGDFFRDNPQLGDGEAWKQSEAYKTVYRPPAPPPPDFLPREAMESTLQHYGQNNFIRYLVQLFGEEQAHHLARAFYLGTSKRWKEEAGGYSVIFWQVDRAGNIRQGKAMAYNPRTGRRLKAEGKSYVSFLGKSILKNKDANLQQCLFGEHQLSQRAAAPVALVESEKTAVIMAGILPDVVWLATGGKHGAKWTEKAVYSALEGRKVILYPDLGAFDTWKERGKILATVCDVQTSDLLERKAAPQDRAEGFDIADYFVKALQDAAKAPAPGAEPVQRKETAFNDTPGQAKIRPQEGPRGQSGPTAHQGEEVAPAGQEVAQDEKRRALWKKAAQLYIAIRARDKAAQAQRAALAWPIFKMDYSKGILI